MLSGEPFAGRDIVEIDQRAAWRAMDAGASAWRRRHAREISPAGIDAESPKKRANSARAVALGRRSASTSRRHVIGRSAA